MKTLRYFLMALFVSAAAATAMVSCKDDDDNGKPDFTADYPEQDAVDGKITIFAKFGTTPCADVVLNGTHNLAANGTDWLVDNPAEMPKFVSAGTIGEKDWGAEGWWKVTIDLDTTTDIKYGDNSALSAVLGAKPVQLKDDKFNWDYQIGYPDATAVEVKSGGVDVVQGYSGECNIYFTSNATAAIIFKTWKKDPCYVYQKRDYTFSVTVPAETSDTSKVRIVGSFGSADLPNWNEKSDSMLLTKGTDGKYSITLSAYEGTDYKYVLNGSWDNEELAASDSTCAAGIANRVLGIGAEFTTVNDKVEHWSGITKDKCP